MLELETTRIMGALLLFVLLYMLTFYLARPIGFRIISTGRKSPHLRATVMMVSILWGFLLGFGSWGAWRLSGFLQGGMWQGIFVGIGFIAYGLGPRPLSSASLIPWQLCLWKTMVALSTLGIVLLLN
jgi:hypothetical protein